MTREDIIRMAQECHLIGMRPHLDGIYQESLERFAAMVVAAAIKDAPDYKMGYADGAVVEREACAKVCESHIDGTPDYNQGAWDCAESIRARGQK